MATGIGQDKDKAARAAQSDLRRLGRETDLLGGLVATAREARAHFSGADDGNGDRIEIWGKRIGRALSATVCIALAVYLYLTYLR